MIHLEIIVSITPRNGAYLMSFDHDQFFVDDATPVELYDAASSLAVAKRLSKEDARKAGCTHLQWVQGGGEHGYHKDTLLLLGVIPDRKDVY